MKSTLKTFLIALLVLFAAALAALYVYLYVMPSYEESKTETYTVQSSTIEDIEEFPCIVVRDEKVYTADAGGTISYYAEETEKTRKGYTVADIYSGGNKTKMNCESTGFVSYYIDGYESYFDPDNFGSLNIEDYIDLNVVPENSVKDTVSSGDPVYKLITSNTWYMMLIVPSEKVSDYSIGQSLKIYLTEEDAITASVSRILGQPSDEYRTIVASTKLFYEDFAKLRCLQVKAIVKETSGLLVPTTALATEDGKTGVYVLSVDETYKFKEVEILLPGDDYTLIKSGANIKLYDEVLRNAADRQY